MEKRRGDGDQYRRNEQRNGKEISTAGAAAGRMGDARAAAFKKSVAVSDLILRISAAVSALAATITMGTTEQTRLFFTQFFQFQASYEDLPAFNFFVITTSISTGYLVLSGPFSVVCVVQPLIMGPRLLLAFWDRLTATLVTSAAASAAAIVYLAHNGTPLQSCRYAAVW